MAKFKPQASYTSDESIRDYRNGQSKSFNVTEVFKDYGTLKKELNRMVSLSVDNCVFVSRSRRGEWGEWFERWQRVNDKIKITKQTWM